MLGPCWHIFRSRASFFRSWPSLGRLLVVCCSSWSLFGALGRLGSKMEAETPHVGAMLALCWHIFRSGASFFRSWMPLARLLGVVFVTFDFFSRFGSLRVGFSGVRGQYGGSEIVFFGVLSCAQVRDAKKLRTCENHSFSCVFVWFLHIASFVFKPQNNAKSFLGPIQKSFLQRLCSNRVFR